MLELLLLGQIPGTDHYISFTEYLYGLGMLLFAAITYYSRYILLILMMILHFRAKKLLREYLRIIKSWKASNVIGKMYPQRFGNR